MNEEPNYLIWSNEHRAWWRRASRGYTTSIIEAGRYSRDEAMNICSGANYDFFFSGTDLPNEIPVVEKDAMICLSRKPTDG